MIGIYMFAAALIFLLIGYPVAFSFGVVAMIFGFIAVFVEIMANGGVLVEVADKFFSMFSMMPYRI
jgi:TRAP-type mannitol/chloroaromatic compound transport system permease large subunit